MRRRYILLADDNRDWADSLAAILRREGYSVHTAYDGAAALSASSALLPDIVILDVGMPQLSGYEIARVFARHPAKTRPLLVAITAWGSQEHRERGRLAGFDLYLLKPIDPDELIRLLGEHMGRSDVR
jgi:DNA-binding response OmpR family regulator